MPIKHICAEPGCRRLIDREGKKNRCSEHWPEFKRKQNQRGARTKQAARRRKAAVALHVAEHGYVCPGYNREPHPSTDLTADHVVPRARGGSEYGELQCLCRSCNAAKGAREASGGYLV